MIQIPEHEMRDLLRDAFMSEMQSLMDYVLVTLVGEFGQNPQVVGHLVDQVVAELPEDVRAFWAPPCPHCGQSHLPIKEHA